jgi:hypothetical protein
VNSDSPDQQVVQAPHIQQAEATLIAANTGTDLYAAQLQLAQAREAEAGNTTSPIDK